MRGIKRRIVKPNCCKNCNNELYNGSTKYCDWECARQTRVNNKPILSDKDIEKINSKEFELKHCKVCENIFPLTVSNKMYCCSSCESFFNYHKNPGFARARSNLHRKKNPQKTKLIHKKSRLKRITIAIQECKEWHNVRREKGLPLRDSVGVQILNRWKEERKSKNEIY